jgi:Tfp pilus assembly major pilin PilA
MANLVALGGMGQMTPAMQNTIRKNAVGTARASGRKVRRNRKKKSAAPRARKAKSAKKNGMAKRLVKGSAAAKAYMKKIRNMRKK